MVDWLSRVLCSCRVVYHQRTWQAALDDDRSLRGRFYAFLRIISITLTGLGETKLLSRAAAQNAKGVIESILRAAGRQPIYAESSARVGDPALVYAVQAAGALETPGSWSEIWTSTGPDNTPGLVAVPDIVPLSQSPRRFMRIEVRH